MEFSQENHGVKRDKTAMAKKIKFFLAIDYQVFTLNISLNIRPR